MGRTKVAHEPVIQRPIRDQVSIAWCDTFDDEVSESRICAQSDGQADGFAHALAIKGIREVVVVQEGLYIGIRGGEPQLASAQGKLETATHPNVVGIVIDDHLHWSMLAGHKNRSNLHVILE